MTLGLHVVQVVQEFSRAGGVETVAYELQRCWEAAGVRAEVLAATVGPAVPAEAARHVRRALPAALADRVATRGRWRHWGRAAAVPAFTLAATAALRRGRRPGGWAEDAVILSHGDSLLADVLVIHAINAANLAQKRREGQWRWRLNPMHAWVGARDRWMLRGRRARRYVAVSRRVVAELETLHAVPRERIVVIPNGVDLERFTPDGAGAGLRAQFAIPAGAPVLLFVGHEFERKGLALAFQALLDPACGAAHLLVVGAGDIPGFARLAAQSGLSARVHFTGPRADLPAIYREADAFLFPTGYETFSLVCMEAMACGVPVFAPAVGGIEDYLVDGHNGQTIPRDGAGIAAALAPFLAEPGRLRALRAGAVGTAQGFGWTVIAARYRDLLQEVWQERHLPLH